MNSQKALVIGHTDTHGVVATAVSMMNLEKEAYTVDKLVKYPETHFPPTFWGETIKTVDPSKYSKIVIVDIPFDRQNFEACKTELKRLGNSTKTVYIDHHTLPGPIGDMINGCEVRMVPSAYQVVYGEPDNYWSVIGAISDRIPTDIRDKITDELMEMSFGLDAASRKDAGEAVERILKNEKQYFMELAKTVPEPENYETKENFVLIKGKVPKGWKLKLMDKAMKKAGSDYALFLSENVPDRRNPDQNCDFLTVTKYWLSELLGTANDILPEEIREKAFGHPNARIVKLPVGEGGTLLREIYTVEPFIGRVKSDLNKILAAETRTYVSGGLFHYGEESTSWTPSVQVSPLTRYALCKTDIHWGKEIRNRWYISADKITQHNIRTRYNEITETARNHPLWVLVKLGEVSLKDIFDKKRIELPPYVVPELPENIRKRLVKTGQVYTLGTSGW